MEHFTWACYVQNSAALDLVFCSHPSPVVYRLSHQQKLLRTTSHEGTDGVQAQFIYLPKSASLIATVYVMSSVMVLYFTELPPTATLE